MRGTGRVSARAQGRKRGEALEKVGEQGQNKLDAHIDRNREEDNGRKEEDNVGEGVQKTGKRPRIGKQQRRRGRAPREGGACN